jgi:type II secretory pathway component GspD/PulD (secretin)
MTIDTTSARHMPPRVPVPHLQLVSPLERLMSNRKPGSVRSVLSAAALFASGIGFPSLALAQDATPRTADVRMNSAQVIERADQLAKDGKLVAAKKSLLSLTTGPGGDNGGVALSDAQRDHVYQLLTSINRRLRSVNPLEVSLQTAELAMSEDDLLNAERHAKAVQKDLSATPAQLDQATRTLGAIKNRRTQARPDAANQLDKAEAQLDQNDMAAARSTLDRLSRLGLELPADVQARLDAAQARVLDWKEPASAPTAILQPGVVKDETAKPAETPAEPPADPAASNPSVREVTPGTPPSAPAPIGEPAPASEPAPAAETAPAASAPAAPTAEAPAAAVPAASPPGEDLVQIARQFEAQSTLAEANQAFEESRLNDAARGYQRVLDLFRGQLTPEQATQAESRLAETKIRLRGNLPEGDAIQSVIGDRQLAKQSALAEFTNQISQAQRALDSGDTGRARELTVSGRVTLNTARNLLGETEYQQYSEQVDTLLTTIDTTQEGIAARKASERSADLQKQAAQNSRSRAEEKERKVLESIERVRALQKEMKYDEALQVVDQILFLDPINPAGLLMKDVLTDASIYRKFNQIQSIKQKTYADQTLENQEAMIRPDNMVDYPDEWPQISFRRGEPVQFAETPENRRILGLLETKRIPVDFKDNTLADVVGFLEAVTNLNIDVDWASLEPLGITRESTVALKLTNVPVQTVLDKVLGKVSSDETNRADWAVTDGVLTIASDAALRLNRSTVVYDIRDLLDEVPDFVDAPQFDLNSVLSGAQGGGGGQSPFQNQGQRPALSARPLEERTQELVTIITKNVDPNGWEDSSGTTGYIQQLNGNLIITNTPKNHRAIGNLLSKLREVRNIQINVEARLLLVNQDFFEQIGFDIDVYFNANNNQVRTARSADRTIQASDFFSNGSLSRTVTGAGNAAGAATGTPTTLTQGVVNPRNTSVIGGSQNSLGLTNALTNSQFADEVTAAAPALGIAGQFLDDIQVDFLIQATQADRRSVSLTAPRLTFTNGQTSFINVSTQQAFVSDLTPVVSESAVGFDPTVSSLTTGVQLLIRGVVSADRRYVQMSLQFSIAELQGFGTSSVTAVAGGAAVNSAAVGSTVQLPLISSTSLNTTVSVPDQGTILMGGQRVTNEVEVETGVPVLSKIPILNRFFSNRSKVQEESTLLMLLKPTILIQNEEEERNFPGLLDSLKTGIGRN